MLSSYDLWRMPAAYRSDDNQYSTLVVRRSPIYSFSAIGKNQPAHFSGSQPRPIRSEWVCPAAIIPGSHVHSPLPFDNIVHLHYPFLPALL